MGTDPSADSGANAEWRGGAKPPLSSPHSDWHQCAKSTSVPRGDRVLLGYAITNLFRWSSFRVLGAQYSHGRSCSGD